MLEWFRHYRNPNLRRAVIAFFVGVFGGILAFVADAFGLKVLGAAAFWLVFVAVVAGIAFILIGIATLLRGRKTRDSQ
jgi:amino acid permease